MRRGFSPMNSGRFDRVGEKMDPDLSASYRAAEALARARARNFYYAFLALPAERRRGFCAVYAFMRRCDDIADSTGGAEEKGRMLELLRGRLASMYGGGPPESPFEPAFQDTVRRYSIPADYFRWLLEGVEMDLAVRRYATFEDLYRYCFRVASAVGLVSLRIFGFRDEAALEHAEHCGIAFQLTNILRDIKEDAAMGRIYLPQEDLERFGYTPEDLLQGLVDGRFRRLMQFQAERVRYYYSMGRRLLYLVDLPSRPALWAMIEIYSRLLGKIVRRQYDVFSGAVGLSAPEKIAIALRALAMRCLPGAPGAR